MPDAEKTKKDLADPQKDHGHRFADLVAFLEATGWTCRVKGSHHIFKHPKVPLLVNLQTDKGGKAKGYQVRQLRKILAQYNP